MSKPDSEVVFGRYMSRRALGRATGAMLASGVALPGSRIAVAQMTGWRLIGAGEIAPSPRWDHTLAAHDRSRQLILFGGRDPAGTPLGDTWRFSRSREQWEPLATSGPLPRFGHAIAVDQQAELLYLFGGQAGSEFYNDLWQFDLASGAWRQLHDGTGAAIAPRYGTSMVLTDEGRLVVSHGFTFEGRFDDTWSYELNAGEWFELTPEPDLPRPLKRCLHEAVWASHLRRMVLYGGCSSGFGPCPQGDLWTFNPSSSTWIDRTAEAAPSARSNPALVYDAGRERVLLLGGLTDQGYAADFWSLSLPGNRSDEASIWTALELAEPSPRASHDAVITGQWLYVLGGNGDAGALNDLWALDVRDLTPG